MTGLSRSASSASRKTTVHRIKQNGPKLVPSLALQSQIICPEIASHGSSRRGSITCRRCKLCCNLFDSGSRPEDSEVAKDARHLCRPCENWSQRHPKSPEIIKWLDVIAQHPQEQKDRLYNYLVGLTGALGPSSTQIHRRMSTRSTASSQWPTRRLSGSSAQTATRIADIEMQPKTQRAKQEHSLLLDHVVKLLGKVLD